MDENDMESTLERGPAPVARQVIHHVLTAYNTTVDRISVHSCGYDTNSMDERRRDAFARWH